jgi:hypothetical protein
MELEKSGLQVALGSFKEESLGKALVVFFLVHACVGFSVFFLSFHMCACVHERK